VGAILSKINIGIEIFGAKLQTAGIENVYIGVFPVSSHRQQRYRGEPAIKSPG
jgi:hypothetical protein